MPIVNKTKCAGFSIRVYRSFQSELQHETNIWEELSLPCPLPFYIAVFHFKHSYCSYLSIFCSKIAPVMNCGKIDTSLMDLLYSYTASISLNSNPWLLCKHHNRDSLALNVRRSIQFPTHVIQQNKPTIKSLTIDAGI